MDYGTREQTRNFYEVWHTVRAFEMQAKSMLERFVIYIDDNARASPVLRGHHIRHLSQGEIEIEAKATNDFKVTDMLTLLEQLDEATSGFTDISMLFHVLDRFDRILKYDNDKHSIISS